MAKAKASAKKTSGADLEKSIVKARDKDELKWREIAENHGMTVGKALLIYECATVPESEKFKGTDAQVATAVKKGRDKGMSWAQLIARSGHTEAWCRRVYSEKGGDVVNVKRGGRYPSDSGGRAEIRPDLADREQGKQAAKPKGKAKPKTQAQKPKAKATKPKAAKPSEMSADELVKATQGKFITTTEGDKFKVASVTNDNGSLEIVDADGEEWGLEPSEVAKITTR